MDSLSGLVADEQEYLGQPREHFTSFVEDQVGQGRYSNASDVMRAGLRRLEEHEARLAALRAALIEGERSGVSSRSVSDIWAAVREEQHGPSG